MNTQTVEQPQPQAQQAALWEDFVDIFFSPGELFRRRADAGFGVAFLVLAAVCVVLYYAFPTVSHAFAQSQISAAMAKNPERAAAMQARGGDPAAGWKFFGALVPFGMFIAIAMTALATWLGAKIASVPLRFKQAMMLNTWTSYVVILQLVIISVLALFKVNRGEALDGVKDRSLGVLRFMDTANTPDWLVGLLSRLDAVAIWQLVLTAIAVVAITKTTKRNAYIVAVIVWLFLAIPMMVAAAFS